MGASNSERPRQGSPTTRLTFTSYLFRRRTLVVPTVLGWACLLVLVAGPAAAWARWGERYLAETQRAPADVLIIEAWTHEQGARAAAAEIQRAPKQYRWVIVAGGLTGDRWSRRRWNEIEIVQREWSRLGMPASLLIGAQTPDTEKHRTYETALVAQACLVAHGIHPAGINVVTRGVHARRSRLTFAKVFSDLPVGVIAWTPPSFEFTQWWRSSERSTEFIKESIGFPYEAIFSSGRPFDGTPSVAQAPMSTAAK